MLFFAMPAVAANAARFKAALPRLHNVIAALPTLRYFHCYPESSKIICGIVSRDDLAQIRSLHAGKWRKFDTSSRGDRNELLSYIATVDGVSVHVNVSELPPSCKIAEEITPVEAHTKRTFRIVCNDPSKEEAAALATI